jgi:hypothetical protein
MHGITELIGLSIGAAFIMKCERRKVLKYAFVVLAVYFLIRIFSLNELSQYNFT